MRIVCGDPSFTDQVNTLEVEGQTVGDADGVGNFDEYLTDDLAVSDGSDRPCFTPEHGVKCTW